MLPNLHTARAAQHHNMLSYWQLAQMGGGKLKTQQVIAHVAHISYNHAPTMLPDGQT